jgi:hypothetical protein
MEPDWPTRPRKLRDTTLSRVDKEAPAYRIIYGVFGGLTPFVRDCEEAGRPVAKSTAHLWLTEGLIPSRRQADVLAVAQWHRKPLDPALFVPAPAPGSAPRPALTKMGATG